MKLYTEEQVIEFMYYNSEYDREEIKERIIEQMTPIELPSDEDIDEQTKDVTSFAYGTGKTLIESYYYSGAKWMKAQILNQNK